MRIVPPLSSLALASTRPDTRVVPVSDWICTSPADLPLALVTLPLSSVTLPLALKTILPFSPRTTESARTLPFCWITPA